MCGYTQSNDGDVFGNHGDVDVWVVKLTNIGAIEWQKCLGGSNYDQGLNIQQTLDGGFILCGYTQSNDGDITSNIGNLDMWVVKISSVIGFDEIKDINEFTIYPNPTSNQFFLKASGKLLGTSYFIYDNNGNVVKSSRLEALQTMIDISCFFDGVYFLNFGDINNTIKIIKN